MTISWHDTDHPESQTGSLKLSFDCDGIREIYLVFQDCDTYPGWEFLKPGFRHVYALERQALGWVCYDASLRDLCCMVLPASWDNDVAGTLVRQNPETTVVQLFCKPSPNKGRLRGGILSCVGVCQYILGVYWPLTLTPHQLFSKILKSDNHIGKGKVWVAEAQDGEQMKQQMHQERKPEDFNRHK